MCEEKKSTPVPFVPFVRGMKPKRKLREGRMGNSGAGKYSMNDLEWRMAA